MKPKNKALQDDNKRLLKEIASDTKDFRKAERALNKQFKPVTKH